MKSLLSSCLVAALAVTALVAGPLAAAAQTEIVYSISSGDNTLRTISPATAATITSIPITVAGETVQNGQGLALNPTTGVLWALLTTNLTPAGTRDLATIDPDTGVATKIGNTGGAFAGLAFDSSGILYGVTGEMATSTADSEALFTLSTTTGAATKVCDLGRGSDGEAIGFNTDDGFVYHASGVIDTKFERVDEPGVPFCEVTDIPIGSPLTDKEVKALGYRPSQGAFLWSLGSTLDGPQLYQVTPAGAPTLIGSLDHVSKGLAVVVVPAPLDHFACYGVLPSGTFASQVVTLVDQFRSTTMTATKATQLCNPVNKNDEDPTAPSHPDHLVAYALTQTSLPKFTPVNGLVVTDQFGTLTIDIVTPTVLLVPSAKSTVSPPTPPASPGVDHFVCYTVKTSAGHPAFVRVNDVSVVDQFGAREVDLTKISRLCAPVDKNGESPGAETHAPHLMCYQTAGTLPTAPNPIFIGNQFGDQQMKVTTVGDLCVPALKSAPPM